MLAKSTPPADEAVKIPAAVRAAAARAESFYKKDEPASSDPPEPPKDAATPETPPELKPESLAQPDPKESGKEPAKDAAPAEPLKDASKDATKETNWEHAYKSMKGRYDRSETTIAQLRERVGDLESTIAGLRHAAPVQPRQKADSFERLVTDKERDEYGSELIDIMGRRAKEELNPLVSELKAELESLKGQLSGAVTQVVKGARQQMLDTLDAQVPNWRELDTDQDFLAWLALPDQYSGAIRHRLLEAAYEQNSAPRVVAFFKGFLSEAASSRDPGLPPAPVEPQSAAPPPAPKLPLESLAAPGRAKSAAASTPPAEKPTYTRAQISQFYAQRSQGHWRGREAEATRIEQDMFDAQREGRIVS